MTGSELRQFRLSLGLTQRELGEILGYHACQVRICEFETGLRKVPERVAGFASDIQTGKLRLEGFSSQDREKSAQIQ